MPPLESTSTTAVIVNDRVRTRRVDAINLACDAREIPTQLPRSYDHWLAGLAGFQGTATHLHAGDVGSAVDATATGTAALAVGEGRMVVIVSPNQSDEPAVWLGVPLADLHVSTSGKIGLMKKRPELISVQGPDWTLALQVVSRFYGSVGAKAGQEAGLAHALGAA